MKWQKENCARRGTRAPDLNKIFYPKPRPCSSFNFSLFILETLLVYYQYPHLHFNFYCTESIIHLEILIILRENRIPTYPDSKKKLVNQSNSVLNRIQVALSRLMAITYTMTSHIYTKFILP